MNAGTDQSVNPRPATRVCVVAPLALPVIDPTVRQPFGGLETEAWLTAKALAGLPNVKPTLLVEHGWPRRRRKIDGVDVVVRARPVQALRQSIDGQLTVVSTFPWVRVDRFQCSLLWKAPLLALLRLVRKPSPDPLNGDPFYASLSADIFCLNGVNSVSASVIAAVRSTGARCLLFLKSNSDLDARYATDPDYRNVNGETSAVCRMAIENADAVIAQTEHQAELLKSRFRREASVLGNPFDHEAWRLLLNEKRELPWRLPERFALWIGRADRFHKRPLDFLEAARRCPGVAFVMVLNPGDPAVDEEIKRTLPPNVQIISQIPYALMPSLFQRSALLVATGSVEYEGLPNVYLQAAATGVPIAALDFMLESLVSAGCAVVGGSTTGLAQDIQRIWDDPARARAMGEAGRRFMDESGSLGRFAERIAELF